MVSDWYKLHAGQSRFAVDRYENLKNVASCQRAARMLRNHHGGLPRQLSETTITIDTVIFRFEI